MSEDLFDYLEEETEPIIKTTEDKEDAIEVIQGLCTKCLNSGFVHDVQDDVLGILYSEVGTDSMGNPIKKLMKCSHEKLKY